MKRDPLGSNSISTADKTHHSSTLDLSDRILEVHGVTKRYGGLNAVDNCSLDVPRGTITGLIGPNGAGKTTLFNVISGFERSNGGTVLFNSHSIDHMNPHELFYQGLVRTFQVPRPIGSMTVLENLVLAAKNQSGERIWNSWFRPATVGKQENEIIDQAIDVLEYVNLIHLRDENAENLSGGQKKLLEFARTLMIDAQLVLLDEPGAGVNRTLLQQLTRYIEEQCYEHGITYLIIEHDMDLVARLCNPVIVMNQGARIFEGTPEEVQQNEEVLEAYLGSQYR